jgi:hypothetical protein
MSEPIQPPESAQRPTMNALIVDADSHVNPSHDMWTDCLPAALRVLAPKVEHGEDCDYVVFEGKRRQINLISAQAGRKGKDFKMEGRVADARAAGFMPRARLEDMDQDGIDTAVLPITAGWRISARMHPSVSPAWAMCRWKAWRAR